MSSLPEPVESLDERGRLCPAPIIALATALRRLPASSVIAMLADDPAADADIPAWCRLKGAELLAVRDPADGGTGRVYLVRLPSG